MKKLKKKEVVREMKTALVLNRELFVFIALIEVQSTGNL